MKNILENSSKLAIFCGAGISKLSGLPLANGLKKYILKKLSIDEKGIAEIMNANIPFESFMEKLHESSDIRLILDVFKNGQPNTNHYFIAKLAKFNFVRTIVTTNFDLLIEKALDEEGVIYNKYVNENQFLNLDFEKYDNKVILIKIHGCADNFDSIRTILKKIAESKLLPARRKILEYLFVSGKHDKVLILGYSCSDVFDISKDIQNIALYANKKEVLYVKHDSEYPDFLKEEFKNLIHSNNDEKKNNELLLFKNFSGLRMQCNTNNLIRALWKMFEVQFGSYPGVKELRTTWEKNIENWYERIASANGRVNYIIGSLFYQTSNFPKSKTYILEALNGLDEEKIEERMSCYVMLGNISQNLSYFKQAIAWYERALNLSPITSNFLLKFSANLNLGITYFSIGYRNEPFEYFSKALEISKKIYDDYPQTKAHCYLNLAKHYQAIGKMEEALNNYETVLTISREIGDKSLEVACLGNMVDYHKSTGHIDAALDCNKNSIEISKLLGNVILESQCLRQSAELNLFLGNINEAENQLNNALELAKKTKDSKELFICLEGLANIFMHTGRFEEAISEYSKILKFANSKRNKILEQECYLKLGLIYKDIGKFNISINFTNSALKLAKELNDPIREISCYELFGTLYYRTNSIEKSIQFSRFALERAQSIGYKIGEMNCYINLGNAYHSMRNYTESINLFTIAKNIAFGLRDKISESICYTNIGNNYLALKLFDEAIEIHNKALAITIDLKDKLGEGICYENLGDVYRLLMNSLQAFAHYSEAKKIYQELGITNCLDRVYEKLSLYKLFLKF